MLVGIAGISSRGHSLAGIAVARALPRAVCATGVGPKAGIKRPRSSFPKAASWVPLLTELKGPDCEPPSPSNSVEVRRRGGCGRALRTVRMRRAAGDLCPVREGCQFTPVPDKRSLLPNRGVAPRATHHRRRCARQETLQIAVTGRRRRSQRFPPRCRSSERPSPGLLREPAARS